MVEAFTLALHGVSCQWLVSYPFSLLQLSLKIALMAPLLTEGISDIWLDQSSEPAEWLFQRWIFDIAPGSWCLDSCPADFHCRHWKVAQNSWWRHLTATCPKLPTKRQAVLAAFAAHVSSFRKTGAPEHPPGDPAVISPDLHSVLSLVALH